MRFAISTPNVGPVTQLIELARETAAGGWDGLFVWDHLHLDRQRLYEMHDPWVLLGAMAPYAAGLRMGPLVTPLPRRRPWVVAKQAVTLDHLTGGRAVLGVGIGWPAHEEFGAFGEPTGDRARADLLDEGLEVVTALWTGDEVHHQGPAYQASAQFHPLPIQQPRLPIWVAAGWPHRRPLERAARWDGVAPISDNGVPLRPEHIAEIARLTGAPRPGFDVVVTAAPGVPAQAYADAGATWLVHSARPEGGFLDDLRRLARSGPPR